MTVLACDVGGTRIKLGVVREGRVLAQAVIPALSAGSLTAQLVLLEAALRALCATQGLAPGDCAGIGIAFPSIIDPRSGRILDHFGKFSDAASVDLAGWARSALGLPLALENDARAALAGEWRYGAGRGCDNLGMVTLGTGIGTCAVIEGRLLRGVHGQAGILGGHVTMDLDGEVCACGNVGCTERLASAGALPRLARAHPQFPGSALAREPELDYRAVFRLAAAGDAVAVDLRDRSLRVWASVAVSLIHSYDLERVVIGGGIMGAAAEILPELRAHVARHAHTPWGKPELEASALGDQAALLGCASLAELTPR